MENAYSSNAVRLFGAPKIFEPENGSKVAPLISKRNEKMRILRALRVFLECQNFDHPPGRRQLHLGREEKRVFL